MAQEQMTQPTAGRRCPNCGTRVARDAESCFMCGYDLRVQPQRGRRVSIIDTLLVLAVLAVLGFWWRIGSQGQQAELVLPQGYTILPTNIPLIDATATAEGVTGLENIPPTVEILPTATPEPLLNTPIPQNLTHTVVSGETLLLISTQYGVTVAELQAANALENTFLRVGQELIIPGSDNVEGVAAVTPTPEGAAPVLAPTPETIDLINTRFNYTVRQADTLVSIALRFGSTLDDVLNANNLDNDAIIRPGDELIIPVAGVPQSVLDSVSANQAAPQTNDDEAAIYESPRLIGPNDEASIRRTESVLLRWVTVDVIAPDEWYVLLLYPSGGSANTLPTVWTKSTSHRLTIDLAPGEDEQAIYTWQVSVVRVSTDAQGVQMLDAASTASELRTFIWQ
ncbi:MAG: LysM peptidoglycan-binding domain-containing protein [Chloroflexota bacterium]